MPVVRLALHPSVLVFAMCIALASGIGFAQDAFADNNAPNPPATPRPYDGAYEQLITASIAWEGGDPDGDGVTYDIYFGVEDDPPLAASGIATLYWMPEAVLEFNTNYRWRIIARDQFGLETAGPVWSFLTKENTPPIPPFDPTPDNQGLANPDVTLKWRSGDTDLQPLTYRVHFGTTNPPPQLVTGLTERSYDVHDLQTYVTYYWRVVAMDDKFQSSSIVWRFYVRPVPVAESTWGKIKALYH